MSIRSLFCRHSWKQISSKKIESQLKRIDDMGFKAPRPQNNIQLDSMTKEIYIDYFFCQKCGKLKKFKTSSCP